MSIYPGDLNHPHVHEMWQKVLPLDGGKIVVLAGYRIRPGEVSGFKAEASVTVSTYQNQDDVYGYSGAILVNKEFKAKRMVDAEIQASNWLASVRQDWTR